MKLQRFSRVCFFLSLLSALLLPTSAFAFSKPCTETLQTAQIKVASVELVKGGRNDRTAVIKTDNDRTFDLGPDLSVPKTGTVIRITYCPQTAEIKTWRLLTKEEKRKAESFHEKITDRKTVLVLLTLIALPFGIIFVCLLTED